MSSIASLPGGCVVRGCVLVLLRLSAEVPHWKETLPSQLVVADANRFVLSRPFDSAWPVVIELAAAAAGVARHRARATASAARMRTDMGLLQRLRSPLRTPAAPNLTRLARASIRERLSSAASQARAQSSAASRRSGSATS